MVLRLSSFIVVILLSVSTSANRGQLGEKKFDLYYGPEFPLVEFTKRNTKHSFKDEREKEKYFQNKISSELFFMQDFFDNEYLVGSSCPDEAYYANKSYIHYLYRLLQLSYTFEGIRTFESLTKQFKLKNSCIQNWEKQFNACLPKSTEMKDFKKIGASISKVMEPVHVSFESTKKEYLNNWLRQLNTNVHVDFAQMRIQSYCDQFTCEKINIKNLNKVLNSICEQDLRRFQNLCSENDRSYGVSEIPELFSALTLSNALRNFESAEFSSGCLKRFVSENKYREVRQPQLERPFSFLYEQKLNDVHIQGRLFSLGALQEFTRKGITDIFKVAKKKEEPKQVTATPKQVMTLAPPTFEIIELPKFVKKTKKKKKIVKKKKKKKVNTGPKYSSFHQAVEFRKKFNLDSLTLDMERFKYDYLFTITIKEKLDPIVKKFGRFQALSEMKKHDSLGAKKAPVPLVYIKYLIEQNSDQLLFNLINVIGEKFYILNDIDKGIKEPVRIKLYNNEQSKYRWQIEILAN